MTSTEVSKRKTGFYWAKLNPVISDGWEIIHWSAAFRSFQIHGKDNHYKEDMFVEIDETKLIHEGYED